MSLLPGAGVGAVGVNGAVKSVGKKLENEGVKAWLSKFSEP
jgi:hypothetical protein